MPHNRPFKPRVQFRKKADFHLACSGPDTFLFTIRRSGDTPGVIMQMCLRVAKTSCFFFEIFRLRVEGGWKRRDFRGYWFSIPDDEDECLFEFRNFFFFALIRFGWFLKSFFFYFEGSIEDDGCKESQRRVLFY